MATRELDTGGPVTAKLADRNPFGAMERLDHDELVREQRASRASPRRRYSLSARALFTVMDQLYGRERTLENAALVDEHPEWEATPFQSSFAGDFGRYASLADLFRQIGYDERLHKLESEARMREPRFR